MDLIRRGRRRFKEAKLLESQLHTRSPSLQLTGFLLISACFTNPHLAGFYTSYPLPGIQAQICCTPLCTAPRPGTKSPPAQSFIPHSFYASILCTCLAITTHTLTDTLQEGVCESPSSTVIDEAVTLGQSAATRRSPGLS